MDCIQKVISQWNDYSRVYADETESGTLQSAITLYNLVGCTKAERIIDAGCGPGLSSQALVSTLMKNGASLYWVDVAERMLDVLQGRFSWNDFGKNPDNSLKKLKLSDVRTKEHIEALEASVNLGPNGRSVYALVSDIEQLPFPDNTFDAYTANLVLQITPNYINTLVESHRTLKPGGKAAFSVWGREENCTFFTFLPDILERYGVNTVPDNYFNFHLNDAEQLVEDAKDIGFKSVKTFYLPSHYSIMSGEEMWQLLSTTSTKKEFERFDEETIQNIRRDVIKEFDARYGKDSEDMISFEVIVILCVK